VFWSVLCISRESVSKKSRFRIDFHFYILGRPEVLRYQDGIARKNDPTPLFLLMQYLPINLFNHPLCSILLRKVSLFPMKMKSYLHRKAASHTKQNIPISFVICLMEQCNRNILLQRNLQRLILNYIILIHKQRIQSPLQKIPSQKVCFIDFFLANGYMG
jgi:hypothetical protein